MLVWTLPPGRGEAVSVRQDNDVRRVRSQAEDGESIINGRHFDFVVLELFVSHTLFR